MENQTKQEIEALRQRVAQLEAFETEYREMEQSLTESLAQVERAKQEWEITADSLPQLISLLDEEGHIIRANRTVERWGLASVRTVKGMEAGNLLRPESPDSDNYLKTFLRQSWDKLAEDRSAELEVEDKQLGRYFHIQLHPFSVQTTRQSKASGSYATLIIQDKTEQKKAEEERIRFTKQLRTTADISQQINVALDPEALLGKVVTLLQSRFNLYQVQVYLVDESGQKLALSVGSGAIGPRLREQDYSVDLAEPENLVARVARRQEMTVVQDSSQQPPHPLLPESRAEVLIPLIAQDKLLGVLDIHHTEPDSFTQADLDTFNTMAGQITTALKNVLAEESQKSTEQMGEVDRLKSKFLSTMNHELKTPLGAIISYSEIMLMGISGDLSAEVREDVQAIHDIGQYLFDKISQILDLAAIEAGQLELDIEPVSIRPLLNEMRANSDKLLGDKPVDFIVEIEDNFPIIEADRLRLNQILDNLVSNAAKFTQEGHITLRAFTDDGRVSLEVQDTGIGIPAAEIDTIFEKFRQIDSALNRYAAGPGLGLAITRYLVEMHGGAIEVRSQLGEGSTFTVRLPLKQP